MSCGVAHIQCRGKSWLIHAMWVATFSSCLFAQTGVTQKPDQPAAPSELRIVQATRVDRTPKLDARSMIRCGKHAVYFGITCFDSDPKKVVATQLRRDVSQHLDDYFEIVIDSAHDRRNAYVFQITLLGTQRDALITEEDQGGGDDDGDAGWDGVWTSEARLNEQGWTATVAIPFSTLNFMKSNDVVWGINFKRFIRRKNEEDLWSGWRRCTGRRASARPENCRASPTLAAAGSLS
jgi:hypothetical protein